MENGLDTSLNKLKVDFAKMCRMVEGMIEDANRVIDSRDRDAAQRIVEFDKQVDDAEMDIEHGCMRLLLRNNPFAKDFREISCMLKAITDVERIGDQAADIAGIVCTLDNSVRLDILREMGSLAVTMVRGSVQSMINMDVGQALEVERLDDDMDRLFSAACGEIVARLKADSRAANDVVQMLMIAKYYERIGDHSVNICEWTQYSNTGVHNKYQ